MTYGCTADSGADYASSSGGSWFGGDSGKGGRNGFEDDWVPFKQTLVVHPRGLVGFIMGALSLTPFVIVIGILTLILFRRDLHTIFLLIGLGFNSMVNLILKPLIAQERPEFNVHLKKYHGEASQQGYGMPSHHSQFMWFFSFYMVLFLMFRVKPPSPRIPGEMAARQRWMYFLLLLAAAASYSRVYLGYHSMDQIIAGALVGIAVGSAWFYFIQHYATPCFLKLLCNPWAQYLLIRDTTLIPNIQMFEYCNIMNAVKHRARARPDQSKCMQQGSVFCSTATEPSNGRKPSCKKHESCF